MLKLLLLAILSAFALAELKKTSWSLKAEVATPNSWPWQVSLQYKHLLASSYIRFYHYCGGSLIQRRWVISSARCIKSVSFVKWRAVLGEHDLGVSSDTEQIIPVFSIYIHPEWSSLVSKGNDIALVKLSSEVTLNSYVQLASLPSPGQILPHNNPCYMTGWGRTYVEKGELLPLKQAFTPVVDYQTCSSRDSWWGVIKPIMICAGRSEITCNAGIYERRGFLGGPLSCQVDGKYYVHGSLSVSSGSGCASREKPPIFTRLSHYMDWINSTMS
ncbi:elastase-1-like [Cyprinodon tularosa]|uniref:elastase-1-like n=1 Tax=Cyprinodon tularosa TaxID=77115 RepID=UPI0018E261C8|nr:elastase-1-like [Cyprinodon tularosa]